MDKGDVVVVGGGCTGASSAMHLAGRGVGRVVLVEREALASASTGKSSAILRQHYTTEIMARLVRGSADLHRARVAFAERPRELGVERRQHTAIRHVWVEHGRVRGVRTTAGDI